MTFVEILTICVILLIAALLFTFYKLYKFSMILLTLEDSIEECLDILDEKYRSMSEILEIPIFFDSVEVRKVVSDIKASRDSLIVVANKLTESTGTKIEEERHEIYSSHIKAAFEKLAENLIYIYGFSRDKDHFYVLKSDCVSFLYETLEKFNPNKGSKAFSYFNVCAKNHLLAGAKKTQKRKIRNVSIDDVTNLNAIEKEMIESHHVIPAQDELFIREEDKKILKEVLMKIRSKPLNENEKLCVDSVITLFQNIEELEFLNKRAVFVYLREISGLNPKQLSSSLSNIRKYYREIVKTDDYFILFG